MRASTFTATARRSNASRPSRPASSPCPPGTSVAASVPRVATEGPGAPKGSAQASVDAHSAEGPSQAVMERASSAPGEQQIASPPPTQHAATLARQLSSWQSLWPLPSSSTPLVQLSMPAAAPARSYSPLAPAPASRLGGGPASVLAIVPASRNGTLGVPASPLAAASPLVVPPRMSPTDPHAGNRAKTSQSQRRLTIASLPAPGRCGDRRRRSLRRRRSSAPACRSTLGAETESASKPAALGESTGCAGGSENTCPSPDATRPMLQRAPRRPA